jgi:hypothetical protein
VQLAAAARHTIALAAESIGAEHQMAFAATMNLAVCLQDALTANTMQR